MNSTVAGRIRGASFAAGADGAAAAVGSGDEIVMGPLRGADSMVNRRFYSCPHHMKCGWRVNALKDFFDLLEHIMIVSPRA
ncbi:MAG TPA: hypothetical protein VK456_11875 [Xanthobacteraceae bacterium]|nr:hypothetical protein [Xanthobacteraceae bacterium]